MSKTHKPVIDAFLKGNNKKISNTEAEDHSLYLFGNKIAWIDLSNNLWIQNCGWFSITTKDRLNMLPNVWIRQEKGMWFYTLDSWKTEIQWNGSALNIGKLK